MDDTIEKTTAVVTEGGAVVGVLLELVLRPRVLRYYTITPCTHTQTLGSWRQGEGSVVMMEDWGTMGIWHGDSKQESGTEIGEELISLITIDRISSTCSTNC